MKKILKNKDGKYNINGNIYDILIGSRAMVWHNTAYKTKGNLTKNDLLMTKYVKIVSKKKHFSAKKEKRLEKYGYFTVKGKFGYVKKSIKQHKTGKSKSNIRKTARRSHMNKS